MVSSDLFRWKCRCDGVGKANVCLESDERQTEERRACADSASPSTRKLQSRHVAQ